MKKVLLVLGFGIWTSGSYASAGYLAAAGNSWIKSPGSDRISQYLSIISSANPKRFDDTINALAFNNSGFMVAHSLQLVENSFDFLGSALPVQTECDWEDGNCHTQRQSAAIFVNAFGGSYKFDSQKNAAFDSTNVGFSAGFNLYQDENLSIGAKYTYASDDMKAAGISGYGHTQSATVFARYTGAGWFANIGGLIGSTKFADDKVVGSITADSRHNGTTGSVSVSAGLDKSAGAMKLQPFAGLRYTNISFKGYADSVKQEFGGWSYGAFTGFTGLSVSRDLQAGGFTVKRELSIGLSYDAIRNFNDNIIVRLPNASVYYIPTDVPEAVAGNGLIGLNVSNGAFGAGLGYRIDLRENFTAHTFFGKLRVTF